MDLRTIAKVAVRRLSDFRAGGITRILEGQLRIGATSCATRPLRPSPGRLQSIRLLGDAKFLTIDDSLGLVGTSNMDIRSFVLNAEHILVIHDPAMTSRLQAEQQRYIADCRSLDLQQWQQRPLRIKFVEHMARLLSPLL